MKKAKEQKPDGRRNNSAPRKDPAERRVQMSFRVKQKNHDWIKKQLMPTVEKLDQSK